MNGFLMLMAMIFWHVFADYSLQGILASMKQKDWWFSQENMQRKYRNDYKAVLIAHAFEWAFVVMLPIFCKLCGDHTGWEVLFYLILLSINTYLHAYIDDLKANKKTINLIQDQVFHMGQIFVTWGLWMIIGGF